MNKIAVSLLAGAAALIATSAQAAPLSPVAPVTDGGIENVRMVCDNFGRCWRERGPRRVIIERDSYNSYNSYEPSYGYRRHHHHHSGPGVHFNAPGVSIGIGGGHRHW